VIVSQTIIGPMARFPNDLITDQLLWYGGHTCNELAMLLRFVDAGDLVYDMGAFAIPQAAAAGAVIAIEAHPANYSRRKRRGKHTLRGMTGAGGRRTFSVRSGGRTGPLAGLCATRAGGHDHAVCWFRNRGGLPVRVDLGVQGRRRTRAPIPLIGRRRFSSLPWI
jgi:hypothetical protein